MIKLVATDLDGTLLDEEKRLPAEIFPLIEQLIGRGVLFAAASGRQYANLRALFAPVQDKIVFLCENGALVKYREETLFSDPIDDFRVKSALKTIRSVPRLSPMLCGVDYTYIESRNEPFYSYALRSYTNCKLVDRLEGVIGREPVCKIAIYDELPAEEHCYRLLPPLLEGLKVTLSGDDWCDVMTPSADKGGAIRFLRGHFCLKREECLAFGDQMNDYEMLLECGAAYVPANAYPPLKERFPSMASNKEGGVVQKLREILERGELL